jgi:ligand-binding sensor domain-containing protein
MFKPDGVNHSFIASLYTDRAGRIWEGNPQGVLLYNKESDRFEHVHYQGELLGHTYAFAEDKVGGLWIGGDKGLYYRDASAQISRIPIHSAGVHIKALVREPDGRLWMGTDAGLFLIQNGSVSTFLPFPKGPIHRNWIHALHRDANGDLWVGLHGEGLAMFEVKHQKFTFYPSVVHPVIRCIILVGCG